VSQASLLVQHDLNHHARGIKEEQATDVEDITDHAQGTSIITTKPPGHPANKRFFDFLQTTHYNCISDYAI
jgi:hypothetical protein